MIKLAIVGLGRWGRVLVDSVQDVSDGVRFTHGVTGTRANAEAYCAARGIALADDLETVLAEPTIDGVVLATPHSQHEAQVVAAAAAGKHVFCEKPFTLTAASAELAIDAATAAGVVLAIGHKLRFLPAMQRMQELIGAGRIGKVLHVDGTTAGHVGARYRAGMWRVDPKESPAGGMAGSGIHVVDAMIHLLGPIIEVQAQSYRVVHDIPFDDTTSLVMRFASGATGSLNVLTATSTTSRLQVFGDTGSLELRDNRFLEHVPVTGERTAWTFAARDTERAELEAFASAIGGGAPFPVGLDDVLAGIKAFEAVPLAAADHQRHRLA